MKIQRRLLNLSVALCLILGWVPYLPASANTSVALEEVRIVSVPLPPHSQDDDKLRAALDALDIARQQGPEAVLALGQTLRGKALDLAMDDIVEAHRQLAQQTPPRPDAPPISEAEELAAVQTQAALDTASRARAFAHQAISLEEHEPDLEPRTPTVPNAPTVDRTVGSPPCTYSTIGAALTLANDGDRLLVEGGAVFTTHLNIHNSVTIQGGYNGCGSGSSAPTTIDADGVGRGIYIQDNLTVTLENLNITNANNAAFGAGIFVDWNSRLIGTNLNIYSNTTTSLGGGVFLYGAQATLTNTEIFSNVAGAGAGVYGRFYNGYAPALNLSSSNDVHHNVALTGSGFGGGVYMSEGEVVVSDCSDIYSNDAIEGGGAYVFSSTLTIQGACTEIMNNTVITNGGGIHAQNSTINLNDDAKLFSNEAGTGGTGSGGGAYLDNSLLSSNKGHIYYNTAAYYGGGVYATNGSELDMDLGNYPCTGPRCSELSYNTATGYYGGGVYATDSEVDLRQTYVENNISTFGGGISAWRDPPTAVRAVYLNNCLFAGNDGGGADGIRLLANTGQTTRLSGNHNTLAYNPSAGNGTAIGLTGTGTLDVILNNSIVWGHILSINDTAQTITYSDIQGGYTGTGNLDVDPLFVDPSSGDFHLQRNSPVIDRCNNVGEMFDFDNQTRPWTVIRPATPYDMGADEVGPRVGINGNPCAYNTIQDAVDAAASGDTLQATAEIFTETVSLNSKVITITGGYDIDCATYIPGAATTVDAAGVDIVFDILTSTVTLRNLNLTNGVYANGAGLRAQLNSHVTLDNTDVFSNYAANTGGGMYINVGSVVTLTNDSDIHDNVAGSRGGGANVWGTLIANDWDSRISYNTAANGGGVSVPSGVLELHGSHIGYNEATDPTGCGGGVYVYDGGVFTATNSSNIMYNEAYDGAGVCAVASYVSLQGAQIHDNVAMNNGGGLYLASSDLDVTGTTNIGYPQPGWGGNEAGIGGGVYAVSSTLEIEGNIRSNRAITQAGGMFAESSVVMLTNTHVGGTDAYEPNDVITGAFGAGLFFSDTQALLSNTVVASNTFSSGVGWGGGILAQNSALTLTDNSIIAYHHAPNMSFLGGTGAGMLLNNSTAALTNSQVLSNTAGIVGGGIAMMLTSTLNVLGDSFIAYNSANDGGGIAATNDPTIHIANATLQHNTATENGGAVYLNAGTLDFSGQWDVRWNEADGNGGAVAIEGTGTADFDASGGESFLAMNTSIGHGGALYVNNDATVSIQAASGYPIQLNSNNAGGHGGVAYADNGALFNVSGQVIASTNLASGNGGVFYLANGSGVRVDEYGDIKPAFPVNRAQNGGVIYAQNSPNIECDGAIFGGDINGNSATPGSGGILYLSGSVFSADNCIFRNSRAINHGGAIAAYTSTLNIRATYPAPIQTTERPADGQPLAPQATQATACDPLVQQCSSFYHNTADSDGNNSGDGGAIYVQDSTLEINHTYLHRNRAHYGGAIYQIGSAAVGDVADSLIYSNTVTSSSGAGIHRADGNFTVTHVTLANNLGGAGFFGVASRVFNSIAWGNGGSGFASSPVSATCNIDEGGLAGLNVDPLFVAPGAGEDYHLLDGSPAINTCAVGLTPDLDNITRPFGSGYDMGVYEFTEASTFFVFLPLVLRQ